MKDKTPETLTFERVETGLKPVLDRTPWRRPLKSFLREAEAAKYYATTRFEDIWFDDDVAQCVLTYHKCSVNVVYENVEWDRSIALVTWRAYVDIPRRPPMASQFDGE